ncbi:MAG TPA: ATP-binding cassette domain-containing protein, partial [Rubrobacteraceae bacterium]|nr:ATP-binding cassette domain-containing protein [Rubrobacteraceae bacterium]
MAEAPIRVDGLTRHYGKRRGISDLTFEVEEGEFFGFLGPNGAGKTTTIRQLMALCARAAVALASSSWAAGTTRCGSTCPEAGKPESRATWTAPRACSWS